MSCPLSLRGGYRFGIFVQASVVCVLLSLNSLLAWADEYSVESKYSAVVRYDDNFRASSGALRDNDLFRGEFASSWEFGKATDISNLTARFALESGTFNDRFDQRVSLGYARDTERGNWAINGSFDNDSIRRSEESGEGSGQFTLANTGAEFYNLSSRLTTRLDELNSLTWSAGASRRRYETEQINDSDFANTSLRWQHSVSNRLRLQSLASVSYFNSDDENLIFNPDLRLDAVIPILGLTAIEVCGFDPQTTLLPASVGGNGMSECFKQRIRENTQITYTGQLGIFYVFNEHLTLDALAGYSQVDSELFDQFNNVLPSDSVDNQTIDSDSGNFSYNLEMNYNQDTLDYRILASTRESANSSGILTKNTEARFEISKRLDERRRMRLNFFWFSQESFVRDVTFLGREVLRVVALYQYSLYENWTIIGEVRYLDQKRRNIDRHTKSTQGVLTVRWQPTTLKWSR